MGTKTGIEWTDATWNPIMGCSRVSEGCRNCYAERMSGRFPNQPAYSGLTQIVNGRAVWTGQIKETKKLLEPLSWRSPKRVFVNSMSDLFHDNVSDELRDRIFAVMALCPQHTFQVLTKRPERMLKYLTGSPWGGIVVQAAKIVADYRRISLADAVANVAFHFNFIPLSNVWLGVSVENQKAADERIPLLLQTPAAKRFISAEPLLGPINLDGDDAEDLHALGCGCENCDCGDRGLDWVICGGESGPGARPMHPDWARSLRDQCQAAGVPFFFKQWGEWHPGWIERAYEVNGHQPSWTNHPEAAPWWPDGTRGFGDRKVNGGCAVSWTKIGKKAAGALLDGREWKQFPEVRA